MPLGDPRIWYYLSHQALAFRSPLGWRDWNLSFSITTREINDVAILDMAGRLSFPEPHLQATLTKLIDAGHRRFVLNLSDVSYIDSYGLQDLVNAYIAVRNKGGKVNLLRPIPTVKKLLELTLKSTFDIFDDDRTAIQAVKT